MINSLIIICVQLNEGMLHDETHHLTVSFREWQRTFFESVEAQCDDAALMNVAATEDDEKVVAQIEKMETANTVLVRERRNFDAWHTSRREEVNRNSTGGVAMF